MPIQPLSIDGVHVPRFLYGTAWKEDATQPLTELALEHGFRGIDTANQRKHYHEAAVGQAIAASIQRGLVARSGLFLQTKFTFRAGQDQRLPYDPNAEVATQVEQSMASSLQHLGVEFVDSYLLHGPMNRSGLSLDDWAAWRTMEKLHDGGKTRFLGVSNVSLEQLRGLHAGARVPPRFVQNRCFAVNSWDRGVREFCTANGLVYQGFSLLTANRESLNHPEVLRIARQHGRSSSQIVFRFAIDIGMLPLTGTSNSTHMQADLEVFEFQLSPEEIRAIETLSAK